MAQKTETATETPRWVTVLMLALFVGALYFAKDILLPLALGVLLSFILSALVTRFERLGLGRIVSVLLAVGIACSIAVGVGLLATRQIIELGEMLPEYKQTLIQRIQSVRSGTDGTLKEVKDAIDDIGAELTQEEKPKPSRSFQEKWFPWLAADEPAADEKEAALAVKVVELPPSPLSQVKTWLGPLVAPVSTLGVVVVLVLFLLINREDLRDRIIQLIGTSSLYATTEAIDDATGRLSRYLRMQLLINTIYGVVVAGGLALIGVPNAILWGIFGTLLRFLPYVGPWIAAIMPITLSLATSTGWSQPLWTVGLFLVLELVVNNVLEPWLYGGSIGMSSMGVILAAIFWTWLWGPIGLVLAMPLTVCAVVLGNYVPQLSFLPVLLGDREALSPHEHMYQRLLAADDLETSRRTDDYLKTHSYAELYDQILIPALHLAERDRHAGLLSERQEGTVIETVQDLIEDLRDRQQSAAESTEGETEQLLAPLASPVLCIPVRDEADQTAAVMLGQVLSSEGFTVEVGSLERLASETVAWVDERQCEIALLVILPPLGSRNGRYLCKRLRQGKPGLHIVAALLDGANLKNTQLRLLDGGADAVATSVPEAVKVVQTLAAKLRTASP